MRTLWKGAVSFGLVNIPVNMYAATENKDLKFNYLHGECMTPIRYEKWCPTCQRAIANEEIVRGYEYQKGMHVVISDEDWARIPHATTKTIDILDFVALSEVDPIYFDKTYYLEAATGGEKAYTLIVEAMRRTNRIAIAKVSIRSKEVLAAIRPKDDTLVMETMFFPDEIRSPSDLNRGVDPELLHENEIKMAIDLIENLSIAFDAKRYQDEQRKALWDIIEAKIEGNIAVTPVSPAPKGNIVDLMEALKQSVKLAEETRKNADKPRRGRKKTGT